MVLRLSVGVGWEWIDLVLLVGLGFDMVAPGQVLFLV